MEKEIKILDIKPEEICATLESLGAKKVFDANRIITHYDTRDGKFAEEEKRIKITKEDGIKLTVTSNVGSDTSEEVKTKVGEEIDGILQKLHLRPIAEVTARRISYEWGVIDFDIDYFPGIPPFLEVDVSSVEDVDGLMEKFGLVSAERRVMGTPEIFTFYGKNYFSEFKVPFRA